MITNQTKNWGIVLVHGVGDTEPGRMIEAVSNPLQEVSRTLTLDSKHESVTLREKLGVGKGESQFPVFLCRGRTASDEILLAEVHWADLTRIGAAPHLLAGAVVRCIYGLRHIALQAALIPGTLGWMAHASLRAPIFLLQGPIYALYLFEAILCLLYLTIIPGYWDDPDLPRAPVLLFLAALTAALPSTVGVAGLV